MFRSPTNVCMFDIDVSPCNNTYYCVGYPMGPFELSDYVGLDTLKFIYDGTCIYSARIAAVDMPSLCRLA